MLYKKLKKYTGLQHMKVGPFAVKQPLPAPGLDQVSPFLLLHHAGPDAYAPGVLKSRLSPHPHRGFEPVTFIFQGKIHHKDSAGHEGFLKGGDVQWMTAGSGIIHSEGPSEEFVLEGGVLELIQLWVNLPREKKMIPPGYQDLPAETIPGWEESGFHVRLIAGTHGKHTGPAHTQTPILAMTMEFADNGRMEIPLPEHFHSLVYVLNGSIESEGVVLEQHNLGVFESGGDSIAFKAKSTGRLLFLAGEPINEPVASYGPFVMNYPGDIKQAILDYETGKMGVLES